jgi:MSHA pilin protein MshC
MFSRQMKIGTFKNPGFTLVEVVVALIIMGIITALAISRLASNNVDLIAQTDVIKSHLRYAQSRAMNSSVIWGIRSSGSSYWLFRDGNASNKVALPGEDSDVVNLLVGMEDFTLSFNSWGIPHTNAPASQELVAGDAECEITVSSGGDTRPIFITPETGFVP